MLVDLILNYAGNYSNLILDPDLDSYWLMDAYITKLPLLMDTQSKASLLALRGAAAGLSADDRIELAGLYKLAGGITADLVNVNFKTIYSYQEEKGKGGLAKTALDDGLRRTEAQNRTYLAGIRSRLAAAEGRTRGGGGPARRRVAGRHRVGARLLGQGLARAGRPHPDPRRQLPRARGRSASASRSWPSLLLVFLFVAFYTAVRESLQSLRGATERMIAGTSDTFAPREPRRDRRHRRLLQRPQPRPRRVALAAGARREGEPRAAGQHPGPAARRVATPPTATSRCARR